MSDRPDDYWQREAKKAITERDELKRVLADDRALDTLRRELRQSLGREKHALDQIEQLRQRECRLKRSETDARLMAADASVKYAAIKRALWQLCESLDDRAMKVRLVAFWEQH